MTAESLAKLMHESYWPEATCLIAILAFAVALFWICMRDDKRSEP